MLKSRSCDVQLRDICEGGGVGFISLASFDKKLKTSRGVLWIKYACEIFSVICV